MGSVSFYGRRPIELRRSSPFTAEARGYVLNRCFPVVPRQEREEDAHAKREERGRRAAALRTRYGRLLDSRKKMRGGIPSKATFNGKLVLALALLWRR